METKTTHTPGPWTLFNLSEENDPHQERATCQWSLVKGGPVVYAKTEWGEEGESNAHLIAAAPELLEALSDIVKFQTNADGFRVRLCDGNRDRVDSEFSILLRRAEVAIRKARGGE